MTENIFLAYEFVDEVATKLTAENLETSLSSNTLTWVDLDASHTETRSWLGNNTSIDEITIEALLADDPRPRMGQIDTGIFVILRGVNLNENASPEDMVSVRLWIDDKKIISLHTRKLKTLTDIADNLNTRYIIQNSGDFITILVERLFERMQPTLELLNEKIDDIEESLLNTTTPLSRDAINTIRKQAIIFKRHLSPKRDALRQLYSSNTKYIDDIHKRKLQESYNHITRYVEDLDAIRERAQIVKDEIVNILNDKLNKNMYILSMIAAIFLPLGFLTGLLGINVGGIPGAENKYAFMIFSGILTLIVIIQIIIFRRLKWF